MATPVVTAAAKEEKAPVVKEKGKALVKAVPSGDTVVLLLVDRQASNPPEKELTFSSVSAPRLARPNSPQDEPFAWQSREFVRKLCIGKTVNYVVENRNPTTNREYGYIFLPNGDNVVKLLVAEGWGRVYQPAAGREARGEHAELLQLTQAAEEQGKGLFNRDKTALESAVRNIVTKFDPLALLERLRGKTIDAFVDQIRSGSSLRVWVTEDTNGTKKHYNILVRIAGVQCPSFSYAPNVPEEPFGRDAKLFTEVRMLHRFVQLTIKGLDKGDTYSGKFLLGGNNIADALLKAGLGHFVDWSAPREDAASLKAAEQSAKQQHLRIWKDFDNSVTQKAPTDPTEFVGKVREVLNGTTLVVADTTGPTPVRRVVALSSIILKKPGTKEEKDERNFAPEAKEFLRNQLVGKNVRVVLDYHRQIPVANQKTENRGFYSVFLDKTNVALLLLDRGLAYVVTHRQNESRSHDYDSLLLAERRAAKKGKGVHGKDDPPAYRYSDLTQPLKEENPKQTKGLSQDAQKKKTGLDLQKAKQFLPFLKRGGRLSAVIEYVFNPARFKIAIPKASCLIFFVLTGIRTPSRRGEVLEPFADDALEFARDKCHQRDVEIEVESQDKGGNFIGNLFVNKKNFAVTLLEAGFASLIPASAERSPFRTELFAAEEEAKKAHRKIWENWSEAAEKERLRKLEQEFEEKSKPRKELINVSVTEIVDGGRFFVQIQDEQQLAQLNDLMADLQKAEKPQDRFSPAVDELCLCKYSGDNQWYRVLVDAVTDDEQYQVFYVDYGNTELVPLSSIRRIQPQFSNLPYQAHECVLAYIKTPSLQEEFGREAAIFLRDLVWGKNMMANVEYRDHEERLYVSLGDPNSHLHVNAEMVKAGLARVENRYENHLAQMISKLKEEEDKAKKQHLCIWRYGDLGDEDDEEEEYSRRRSRR